MTSNGDLDHESDLARTAGSPSPSSTPLKRAKPKRTKALVASAGALVILTGGGLAAGTLYYDSVPVPGPVAFAQTTQIMASDGQTQLAQVGTVNRTAVPVATIPDRARQALIAGVDPDFYEDSWGGSAVTRAYVRITAGAGLGKPRLAVAARKMEDKYTRDEILGFFLNAADFGRGAVGVEKAAQAYFAKHAAGLTVAEAAVLGAVVGSPYSSNGGPSAYDPQAHPDEARARWTAVLDAMAGKGWLTATDRAGLQMPQVRPASASSGAEWGLKTAEGDPQPATGNVVNYVYAELQAQGIDPKELKTGGYRITTSIDPQAQHLLERYARPDLKGSQLHGRTIVKDANGRVQQDLESAGVVIDHTTGRVLAYYGGLDATGTDLAGLNTGGNGPFGGHEPGASMEVYTLAAALESGASLQSRWKAMPFTTDDKMKIGNNGASVVSCFDYCTLEDSFAKGRNVPFYWVARQIGPGRVVRMASAAGVRHLWDNAGRAHDLQREDPEDGSRSPFDRQVGYGQYAMTVLDHAAGVSTFANGGLANKPHFVVTIEKLDPATGKYKVVGGEKPAPQQTIRTVVADDVTAAMQRTVADRGWAAALKGRPAAVAPGIWGGTTVDKEGHPAPSSDYAHAWAVGFTKQITVAVWTGNAAGFAPVTDPVTNRTIAAATPFRIWSGFVNDYSAAKGLPKEALAGRSDIGSTDFPGANGVSPAPSGGRG